MPTYKLREIHQTRPMKTSPFVNLCVIVSAFLLGFGAQANTKWEPVALDESGTFYVDPKSITQEDGVRTVWSALDYKKPQSTAQGKAYRSARSQIKLNCSKKTAMIMHLTYHTGPMLTGEVLHRQGMLHEWMAIDPSSPIHKIARRVC